jgi:hypothetical protein
LDGVGMARRFTPRQNQPAPLRVPNRAPGQSFDLLKQYVPLLHLSQAISHAPPFS